MLFHVYINVRIPHDADQEKNKKLGTLKHENAKALKYQEK
jgi:muconolactone delta-isomerase